MINKCLFLGILSASLMCVFAHLQGFTMSGFQVIITIVVMTLAMWSLKKTEEEMERDEAEQMKGGE